MVDFLVILLLLAIVGAAGIHVYRAKKAGQKCIGCPAAKSCSGCCASGKETNCK